MLAAASCLFLVSSKLKGNTFGSPLTLYEEQEMGPCGASWTRHAKLTYRESFGNLHTTLCKLGPFGATWPDVKPGSTRQTELKIP